MAVSREQFHRLIDALSDDKLDFLARKLPELIPDIDDAWLSSQDMKEIQEARAEFARGEYATFEEVFGDLED